jgi:hypothetical protein
MITNDLLGGLNVDLSKNAPFSSYRGQEPYIFISYAHKNAEIVFPYIAELNELGYRIWYDEGISPGAEWPDAIAAAITRCDLMITFLSPDAVNSVNVRNEINFALTKGKKMLFIYILETVLPDGLALQIGSIQAIMKNRLKDMGCFRDLMMVSLPKKTRDDSVRISQTPVQKLYDVFETISKDMSSYFSGTLRTLCEVSVASPEERIFKEFWKSLPSHVVLAVINLAPLKGSILMAITPAVANGIINRLFGGNGNLDGHDRSYTEIEIAGTHFAPVSTADSAGVGEDCESRAYASNDRNRESVHL